jgi:hypothetical protein
LFDIARDFFSCFVFWQARSQRALERFQIQRFGDVHVHARVQCVVYIFDKDVGRHGDDGDALRFRMVRGADEPRWANRKLEKPSHREKLFDG